MSGSHTLNEINNMDRRAFIAAFGAVFEASPWAAEAAWQSHPFRNTAHVAEALFTAVRNAGPERQLALLRAHPELGARKPLAAFSAREQAGAGLQREQDDQVDLLADLNRRYREKFGFPFILAVKGLNPDKIITRFCARLENNPEEEFNECLEQVFRIAAFRLEDLLESE
ncbi:MAG: 2-oxo-4-hydroxy-4-carboxy-5-ureidoimidazoline decarboxylase [Gammaproteobacteria bacterium]|nr:2-oxo-4-hydroxy-4-carboxy-5-ureidoimidazoline decarboxylase [Gammaproteobacteria bacterium]